MRRNLSRSVQEEAGYSLVEVLAAIVILAAAIIPMVGMFDAALRAAQASGDYDEARMLANAELESLRAAGYERSVNEYPPTAGRACAETREGFTCTVDTAHLALDATGGSAELREVGAPSETQPLLRVTVTVGWGEGREYEVTGVLAE